MLRPLVIASALFPFAISAQDMSHTAPDALKGAVVNYNYSDNDGHVLGAFRLQVDEDTISWDATAGSPELTGYYSTVSPIYSEVDTGIWFISWVTGTGGDFIVLDTQNMTVSAHVYGSSEGNITHMAIGGSITCFGTAETCDGPDLTKPQKTADL